MPRFLPFRAVYPTPNASDRIADLCTPPFDELDLTTRQERASRHQHNFVRFESGHDLPSDRPNADLYARAATALQDVRQSHCLAEDPKTAYYLMEIAGPTERTRGFIGMLELHSIVQHQPFALHAEADVSDRLWQLQTLELQTAPVTLGYRTTESGAHQITGIMDAVSKKKPVQQFTAADGQTITIWRTYPEEHELEPLLSQKRTIILDGVARFEAARKFAEQAAKADPSPSPFQSYNFILAWMVDIEREAISFRPWHRALKAGSIPQMDGQKLLAQLEDYFEIERYKLATQGSKEAELVNLIDEMDCIGRLNHSFGLYVGDKAYYLLYLRDADSYEKMLGIPHSRRWKRLDAAVLHAIVFEGILGIGWSSQQDLAKTISSLAPNRAVALVDDGFADAVFLLNAPLAQHIFEIAEANEPLPSRSALLERRPLVGPVMAGIGAHRFVGDDLGQKQKRLTRTIRGSKHATPKGAHPARHK